MGNAAWVVKWNKRKDNYAPYTVKITNGKYLPVAYDSVWETDYEVPENRTTLLPARISSLVELTDVKQEPELTVDYGPKFSQGYFEMLVSLTIPIPTALTSLVGYGPISITGIFTLDASFPAGGYDNGKYYPPEAFKVTFNGFDTVKRFLAPAFELVRGRYLGSFVVDAVARHIETYPIPHIVLTWTVEVEGSISASVEKVDYDIGLFYSIGSASNFLNWRGEEQSLRSWSMTSE